MHQVYDDETTFKLVAAASNVSGLPIEVCLEEFGKHFLVYCQKNGYDQILRVLGSNLYDFLTNLDNLHDHLASIYPGMRAPSFRVTKQLESSLLAPREPPAKEQQQEQKQDSNTAQSCACNCDRGSSNGSQPEGAQCGICAREQASRRGSNNEAKQQQQQRQQGSMYLHYYSDRNGLSPIVKGLVMAVAKEFFSTDIQVTECAQEKGDHVVLKIDRRSQAHIALDEQSSQAVELAALETTADEHPPETEQEQDQDQEAELRATSGEGRGSQEGGVAAGEAQVVGRQRRKSVRSTNETNRRTNAEERQCKQKAAMLSAAYGDLLSKRAHDSLINSEIMMQTFPFHVIFDRQFNIVQVGKSLFRLSSNFWQRHQERVGRHRGASMSSAESSTSGQSNAVKFSHLFSIVRPKIEFTFDAIADHTNQVFVVRTRRHVLNADHSSSLPSAPGSAGSAGRSAALAQTVARQQVCSQGASVQRLKQRSQSISPATNSAQQQQSQQKQQFQLRQSQQPTSGPMCPFDRAARERRMTAAGDLQDHEGAFRSHEEARKGGPEVEGANGTNSGKGAHHEEAAGELVTHVSLRLKGQMIILNNEEACYCLFLCSPRVDHLDQLVECGVNMSDFALHDRARELILMSHTHKEDRETVKKLDQASNDLKKMDTKLRQENKRTNEVLHNIFPAKIASLLSHGHQIESESHELVSCLYSDIIGFTKMCGSDNVRPIDIVRLLNTLYLQFDNLTNIHGVYKVETIGDAYVVVGGLPEPVDDHADRCVRMGLDMVKVIATVRSPADNQPIQVSGARRIFSVDFLKNFFLKNPKTLFVDFAHEFLAIFCHF